MNWTLDGLAGHDGYALALLPDGRVIRAGDGVEPGSVTGYVAGCGCGWVGELYYPDPQGARGHWERYHARPRRNPSDDDPDRPADRVPDARPDDEDGPAGALFIELDDLLAELDQLARMHPVAVLAGLRRLETTVDAQLARAVQAARDTGLTWARIGDQLGMTRQSAHQRFSRPG